MIAPQPKITSVTEVSQLGSNRQLEPHVKVTFTIGNHGPFTEVFSKASFDPSTVNQKLQDFANKLGLINSAV